jgi:hypothetical protein
MSRAIPPIPLYAFMACMAAPSPVTCHLSLLPQFLGHVKIPSASLISTPQPSKDGIPSEADGIPVAGEQPACVYHHTCTHRVG